MPVFFSNSIAILSSAIGFDSYGETLFAPAQTLLVNIIKYLVEATPTPIRSEASASRGKDDDLIAKTVEVLFPSRCGIKLNDRVDLNGDIFRVLSLFPRVDLFGRSDHIVVHLRTMSGG